MVNFIEFRSAAREAGKAISEWVLLEIPLHELLRTKTTLSPILSLSLSLSHTHTHTHTHTHSLTHISTFLTYLPLPLLIFLPFVKIYSAAIYCIAQKLQVYFLSCVGIYKEKCCQVRSLSVFHFSLTLSICLSVSFSFSHQHKHITHTHSHIFSLSPFLSPLKIRPCPSPYSCVGNPAKMCWERNLSLKNCLQILYKTFSP